jgi:hypothetical protein
MFGSTALEIAIGLIFVYILLSLLCSALNELLEVFLKFRAKDLEKGIRTLLNDPRGEGLAGAVFQHPLIKGLAQEGRRPSYIPARTFVLVLWNLIYPSDLNQSPASISGPNQLQALRAGLNEKYLNPDVRVALLALIDEAGNNINQARGNIEEWYNDAMDRVSGGYKRRTHIILLVLGLAMSAALNADSIYIANTLAQDDVLRNSVMAVAENYARTTPPAGSDISPTDKIRQIRGQINQLGLPIGWGSATDQRAIPDNAYGWYLKILGLFLTALAISLGAPFWFDLLNRFVVVRSTVKPHEKSPEQPSKDRSNYEDVDKEDKQSKD